MESLKYTKRWLNVWILAAAVVVAGCGGGEPDDGADVASDQAAADEAMELDEAQIAALMEQYPRLREEPLPEPEPNGDAEGRSLETTTGDATFYANTFEGRRTASGIPFRQNQMVAAHRAYPFGTILRVTNTRNDRSVNVRVVDRGPFGSSAKQKRTVIDLSRRAAEQLGYVQAGRTPVRVEVLEWGQGIAS